MRGKLCIRFSRQIAAHGYVRCTIYVGLQKPAIVARLLFRAGPDLITPLRAQLPHTPGGASALPARPLACGRGRLDQVHGPSPAPHVCRGQSHRVNKWPERSVRRFPVSPDGPLLGLHPRHFVAIDDRSIRRGSRARLTRARIVVRPCQTARSCEISVDFAGLRGFCCLSRRQTDSQWRLSTLPGVNTCVRLP
jgi:hypothetical protein